MVMQGYLDGFSDKFGEVCLFVFVGMIDCGSFDVSGMLCFDLLGVELKLIMCNLDIVCFEFYFSVLLNVIIVSVCLISDGQLYYDVCGCMFLLCYCGNIVLEWVCVQDKFIGDDFLCWCMFIVL